jgi:hypothetical protein
LLYVDSTHGNYIHYLPVETHRFRAQSFFRKL